MILLLGGTSDAAPLADALAERGYRVLVSTATEIPLAVGSHPEIERRHGRLDESEMVALIRERRIRALVDATHPYAAQVKALARRAAHVTGIPYFTLTRPGIAAPVEGLQWAADHREAAVIAFRSGKPVLLTIGSSNLGFYAMEARRSGVPLMARVLPHPESIEACRVAGISNNRIISGRGPFSVDENRQHIRKFGIGTLVTKDSGAAGGVPEKMEAAKQEGCRVVVVSRPLQSSEDAFSNIESLVRELSARLRPLANS